MEFKNIASNPAILGGKLIIKNTLISVDFILQLIASGGTIDSVVEKYPQLNRVTIVETLLYAQERK